MEWSEDVSGFGDGEDHQVKMQRLCVDDDEFWFEYYPCNDPHLVHSDRINISNLLQILQGDESVQLSQLLKDAQRPRKVPVFLLPVA